MLWKPDFRRIFRLIDVFKKLIILFYKELGELKEKLEFEREEKKNILLQLEDLKISTQVNDKLKLIEEVIWNFTQNTGLQSH